MNIFVFKSTKLLLIINNGVKQTKWGWIGTKRLQSDPEFPAAEGFINGLFDATPDLCSLSMLNITYAIRYWLIVHFERYWNYFAVRVCQLVLTLKIRFIHMVNNILIKDFAS